MSTPALCQECPLCGRPRMPASHLQRPDILFVGGYPLEADVKAGAFMGKNSSLLRKLIQTMQSKRSPGDQLYVDYAYACQCSPTYDYEKKRFQISVEEIKRCSRYLRERIDRTFPAVIVAMGADALRALEFKGNQRDMREASITSRVVMVSRSRSLLPTMWLKWLNPPAWYPPSRRIWKRPSPWPGTVWSTRKWTFGHR